MKEIQSGETVQPKHFVLLKIGTVWLTAGAGIDGGGHRIRLSLRKKRSQKHPHRLTNSPLLVATQSGEHG